jgi:hypothetical protein
VNVAIELHDSELANVDVVGTRVRISLRPAYIHKSLGTPGVDAGTGWIQEIDLVIEDGLVKGELRKLPADLGGGELSVDEHSISNVLPLPLNTIGRIVLTLELKWGGVIHVHGSRIVAEPINEAKYVEEFRAI